MYGYQYVAGPRRERIPAADAHDGQTKSIRVINPGGSRLRLNDVPCKVDEEDEESRASST